MWLFAVEWQPVEHFFSFCCTLVKCTLASASAKLYAYCWKSSILSWILSTIPTWSCIGWHFCVTYAFCSNEMGHKIANGLVYSCEAVPFMDINRIGACSYKWEQHLVNELLLWKWVGSCLCILFAASELIHQCDKCMFTSHVTLWLVLLLLICCTWMFP